jgi:hypothetical protein
MSNPRRERLFLSSVSFFTTFGATRAITHGIRSGHGPFHNLSTRGRHVHHLVFGIAGLLGTGYLWLLQVGTGTADPAQERLSRLTALLYGSSSALTLDEFALWLDLRDVYWTREGRASVDAVLLFGAVLSMGVWGGPFFRELLREAARI